MGDAAYPPPLDALLTLGDPRNIDAAPVRWKRDPDALDDMDVPHRPDPFRHAFWPNYRLFDIGPEHIPDLIRMATDKRLTWAGPETAEVWAPLHAYRALGQFRAAEAIEPLLRLFDPLEDDDWFNEEMPDVFGLIGPAAIPALTTFLGSRSHLLDPRTTAASALTKIGRMHPEARDTVVAALTGQLESFAKEDESLNAFIISDLIDLGATESLPLVERAYAADRVDVSILGDWEEAQIAFGVKTERETPARNWIAEWDQRVERRLAAAAAAVTEAHRRNAEKKARNKKKMADKSRKINRKRK